MSLKKLLSAFAVIGLLAVAGCNTMEGVGHDISKGGQALSNSAEKHNPSH
ncbi:entericidin A/B family lipoprotein [Brackiella oedipodis]|nr:entericidin A/B family lipoprotein [Brackiella oedipodis]